MRQNNENVLEIKNISVSFDGFFALKDVNAKVKRNSIHFFLDQMEREKPLYWILSVQRQDRHKEISCTIQRIVSRCGLRR